MATSPIAGLLRTNFLSADGKVSWQWMQFFNRLAILGQLASPLPVFANNAAALAGGLAVNSFYRNGGNPDVVCVVH